MSRELVLVVDALAHEKGVSKEIVFKALEQALASAICKHLHANVDVEVAIDREKGEYQAWRLWKVVETLEDQERQVTLPEAQKIDPNAQIGSIIREPLAHIDLGRISAQTAKQVMLQKVREAEKSQLLEDFLLRGTKLVNGTVKRIERGHAIIEVGKIVGLLRREQMIPRENFRVNDRVRAYIIKVEPEARGPQLLLSRTCPEFLAALFALEVPEIEMGLVEIKAVARDPGQRAKIAVKSNDPRTDPIGTCVGLKGSRVQAVTNELGGERIDIILWSEDPVQFILNAMAPAAIESISVDEDTHCVNVIVAPESLSQAIGKGGQNVQLASALTGWVINVLSRDEAEEKEQQEAAKIFNFFIEKLQCSEEIAELLVNEGFSSLEELAYIPKHELVALGLEQSVVDDLRAKARHTLLLEELHENDSDTEIASRLRSVVAADDESLQKLVGAGITSVEALADFSADELSEQAGIDEEKAKALIIAARAPWFNEAQAGSK